MQHVAHIFCLHFILSCHLNTWTSLHVDQVCVTDSYCRFSLSVINQSVLSKEDAVHCGTALEALRLYSELIMKEICYFSKHKSEHELLSAVNL